ncbi:MAG: 1,4-dihydroxy-2-naphthoate polyprenyltransferase [Myxococcota bacterium]
MAIRPRTLSAGVVPVAVGSSLAFAQGVGRPLAALAALAGALLIQVGTNLANDYYDFVRGADTGERLGPPRVTQQGLLAPPRVLAAALGAFAAATLVGVYLVIVAGWPIVVVGLVSILAGYAYTGGPFPLGYHGLGDLFVFIFFGVVAVAGSYYVQALALHPAVWFAAMPVGALGTVLLVVNNLRDVRTDARAGKRTLVVLLGVPAARSEYVFLLVAAFATPVAMWALGVARPWVLLPLTCLPLVFRPLRCVLTREGAALNEALRDTARLGLVFGLLFAVGLWLGGAR